MYHVQESEKRKELMNIIIAGAGRVGFKLAKMLSVTNHVTVIDHNAEALKRLQESLDILVVHGNIEDPATYKKVVIEKSDLFIVVTDSDETNLIATLIIDDVIDVERKFIRLRNTYFSKSAIKDKLSIAETIFPLQLTSATVASLFDYPKANNVKHFKYTDAKLLSVRASDATELADFEDEYSRIIGIERDKQFFVPDENTSIQKNDLVYLFGKAERVKYLSGMLETLELQSISRCVIFGAGDVGISIAKSLKERGKEIKLVDKNIEQCERADEALEGTALTINCKYGTEELFAEEGLAHADMMIAATSNDEYNIIKCLEAREHGIQKVVAIINELEYYNLMHALGIVVVRGPKMSAYNEIMERIYSNNVVMERKFCGGKANIYLRKIFAGSPLINKTLKPFKNKENAPSYIIREEVLHPFDKPLVGKEGDVIVVFCEYTLSSKAKSWIYGL
jgi:trk system potassium uptake protein TrkA